MTGTPHRKTEIMEELIRLRRRVAELEAEVAERRQAQDDLEAQRAQVDQLFHRAPEALVLLDENSRVLNLNAAFTRLFGYEIEEARGRQINDLVAPETLKRLPPHMTALVPLGEMPAVERIRQAKDGSLVHVAIISTPILLEGNRTGYYTIYRDITERVRAEETLRQSEERYRAIFEQSRDAIYVSSPEGRLIDINQAGSAIFGYSREEFKRINALKHYKRPADRQKAQVELERKGFFRDWETTLLHKDGREITCLDTATVWRDEDGRIIGYIGMLRDITETKKALEALKESERRLGTLMNNLPGMAYRCANDRDWTAEFVSQGCLGLTGLLAEDLIGSRRRSYADLIHPKDRQPVWDQIQAALSQRKPFEIVYRIRTISGEEKWVWEQGVGVLSAQGEVQALEGYIVDISESKRAEEALRLSEEKFSKAFQESPVWVIISSFDDGRYIEVNETYLRTTGFTREEVIGRTSIELGTWVDVADRSKMIRAIEEQGSVKNWEVRRKNKAGDILYMLISGEAIFFGGQKCLVSVSLDITEYKRAAEERRRLEAQLRQVQKMEAIGALAGGIAHDFNNILAAVLGYTQLALDDVSEDHPVKPSLRQVLQAGRRAKNLVQQILSFSRQAEQEHRPVYVGPIVREALKLLRASIPTTIEIRQRLETESRAVLADPTEIHQVVMNLCTNASQAMREKGGLLEVSLQTLALDEEAAAQFAELCPGAYQRLKISDTGSGMDQATAARIFEPYFTTKEPGEGTGLGLSVVHGIVKSCRGAITVASQPGRGSTFEIFLPLIEHQEESQLRKEVKPLPTGTERLLFVDDEEALADIGHQILKRLGYRVTVKTSSLEALETFKAGPHEFDLVITDQTMPHLTGADLAQEMLRLRPDMPIILCTGFSESINAEEARALGIRRFLLKPLVAREIAEVVREVLGG